MQADLNFCQYKKRINSWRKYLICKFFFLKQLYFLENFINFIFPKSIYCVIAEMKNYKNLIIPQLLNLKKENLISLVEQGIVEV